MGGLAWLVGLVGSDRVGVARTVLDGNVTTDTVGGGASAVVVLESLGHVLDLAHVLLKFGLQGISKDGAVLDAARRVGAGGNGFLESINVPSVHKVTVVSAACWVSVGCGWVKRVCKGETYRWCHRWTRRIHQPGP